LSFASTAAATAWLAAKARPHPDRDTARNASETERDEEAYGTCADDGEGLAMYSG
jgi:hypothetical protein